MFQIIVNAGMVKVLKIRSLLIKYKSSPAETLTLAGAVPSHCVHSTQLKERKRERNKRGALFEQHDNFCWFLSNFVLGKFTRIVTLSKAKGLCEIKIGLSQY